MKLRDTLWIWGQDPGTHHKAGNNVWNLPGVNRMGPVEAAKYLGIPNCCRVVYGGSPRPPFDAESAKLAGFREVVWSALGDASSARNEKGADDLDEVLRQAEKFPNVTGCVLDDLFHPADKSARVTAERIREMADKLHAAPRPLSLWLVCYPTLFGIDYRAWFDAADVITFWPWTEEHLARTEENLLRMIELTPGKRHYAGNYLFGFGFRKKREITAAETWMQLEIYRRLWHAGAIDGVITCANTVVDLGFEAPDAFRDWLAEHGDECR